MYWNVANIATKASLPVAISETALRFANRYSPSMLAEWVESAIATAGKTQAEVSRELTAALGRSIDRAAVNKMVKGTRKVAADEMMELAKITGVPAPIEAPALKTPVLGYVGAGAVWAPYDVGTIDEIDRPAWANEKTVAAEIRGDSLGSMFDRWLVYYDDVREAPSPKMLGKLCIVWLADSRVLVKQVHRGQVSGLFTLTSNFAEPIYDVALDRCALVKNMAPR